VEVTFRLTPADLKAFESFASGDKHLPRWATVLIMLVVAPALFALQWVTRPQPLRAPRLEGGNVWAGIVGIALPLVFFVLFWGFILWQQKRKREADAKSPFLANGHTVILSPEFLLHRNEGASESRTLWPAIHRIGSDARGVYFFFSENIGLVVPAHAFSDEEHARRFHQFALAQWQHARGEGQSPPIPTPSR
jgi:hypothetical protein